MLLILLPHVATSDPEHCLNHGRVSIKFGEVCLSQETLAVVLCFVAKSLKLTHCMAARLKALSGSHPFPVPYFFVAGAVTTSRHGDGCAAYKKVIGGVLGWICRCLTCDCHFHLRQGASSLSIFEMCSMRKSKRWM